MKKIFLMMISCLFGFTAFAQQWHTDFNEAKTIAKKHNEPIILVFQGSDWCAPCIKLNKEIWSSDVFKDYAKNHFVMLQADFPRKSKNELSKEQQEKNNTLAAKYNTNGYFPFVVVLNDEGKVLGETGYKKTTPQEYINLINSFVK
ncbi:thioredoxin family protein [Zhouia sp. PK063]|uniref:thioredoxin family protein n=1 Tax=Zhouia sp. PK063 TaxID=3373602 RepID=UPI0037BB5825